MKNQLKKISISAINTLLADIANFTQALYSNKDYPNKEKDYESIKARVHEMSSIILSYESPVMNKSELVTDINDPRYNPIEVFNKVILPVHGSYAIHEFIDNPDDEAFERIKESIADYTLKASDVTLELYPKWKKHIRINYIYDYITPNNGDIGFPIGGLSGNLQVLLLEKYLSRIFPDGNVYIYHREGDTFMSDYEEPEKAVYLTFKDSSDIAMADYDPEEDEYYPSPYFRTKGDIGARLADAAYTILKNTTVYSIRNRYSIPWQ